VLWLQCEAKDIIVDHLAFRTFGVCIYTIFRPDSSLLSHLQSHPSTLRTA
jgi:hypothetical protein